MPTETECRELISACNTTWVTNYRGTDINGRLFTLKSDPTKTLFFPAAGNLNDTNWGSVNTGCTYLSSSLNTSSSCCDICFYFNSNNCDIGRTDSRCAGHVIRAVKPI